MKYEVTLTLRPHLYQFTPNKQFQLTSELLWKITEPWGECCTFVAELTNENNIHYHGVVVLNDLMERNRFLNRFRPHAKVFGRKTCMQVKYELSYEEYMRKDFKYTEEIIGHCPIVRDAHSIFSMKKFEEDRLQKKMDFDPFFEFGNVTSKNNFYKNKLL